MRWKAAGVASALAIATLLTAGKSPRAETTQERAIDRALDYQHERLGGIFPYPYSVKVEPRKDGLWLVTIQIELVEVMGGKGYLIYDPEKDQITSWHMEE